MAAPLKLTLDGETDVIATRHFDAPPALVYRAHLEPALIRKWMTSMPGWRMPICEVDARPGGRFRFGYEQDDGPGFRIEGGYIALEPDARIVHVERMYLPDPTPDNHHDTRFDLAGNGTKMTLRMRLPDSAARQAMLDMGGDGMELSYAALDALVQSLAD